MTSHSISFKDSVPPTISVTEKGGLMYLRIRVLPAPDGCNYIPCTDIAALYEAMRRAPTNASGIGVKLDFEDSPA